MKTRKHEAPAYLFGFAAVILSATLMISGCTALQSPVPVYGPDDDLASLVGAWLGEYSSMDTGRHGTVTFTLAAEADTAFGDVLMEARGWDDHPMDEMNARSQHPSAPIKIRFVQIGKGHLVGRLDGYRDPVCGCLLETIFEGHVDDDIIEGLFTSHSDGFHPTTMGQWWVKRKAMPTSLSR